LTTLPGVSTTLYPVPFTVEMRYSFWLTQPRRARLQIFHLNLNPLTSTANGWIARWIIGVRMMFASVFGIFKMKRELMPVNLP